MHKGRMHFLDAMNAIRLIEMRLTTIRRFFLSAQVFGNFALRVP
jgi:hypothetical protein